MAEVLFYQLSQSPLEHNLPGILQKSLERGWRVLVRGTDKGRLRFLDEYLWSHPEEGFLPHGLEGDGKESDQPVLLTQNRLGRTHGEVLILIDGARYEAAEAKEYQRVCLIFDGNDPDSLTAARADWKIVKADGSDATYWAQESGRWVKKG